mmetsp:Transcript_81368/g.143611  ORF Transcript_81368/g.143611 Transcript_81368/m.143611 type:complete len:127 (+) Transcript_81368:466-846(+)
MLLSQQKLIQPCYKPRPPETLWRRLGGLIRSFTRKRKDWKQSSPHIQLPNARGTRTGRLSALIEVTLCCLTWTDTLSVGTFLTFNWLMLVGPVLGQATHSFTELDLSGGRAVSCHSCPWMYVDGTS